MSGLKQARPKAPGAAWSIPNPTFKPFTTTSSNNSIILLHPVTLLLLDIPSVFNFTYPSLGGVHQTCITSRNGRKPKPDRPTRTQTKVNG
ncbi:hypothetical protein QL285_023279 [Trifolium repens]|nr:hypothetical protein QL285_023279 [Trifolium repens]